MEWYRIVFCLVLKLVFDVSVSNQTGRRLDMSSRLETLRKIYARIRVFKRTDYCFSISEIVLFLSSRLFSRDWETGSSWRAKRIEMTLFNNGYHRLFDATLAAEMAPLSVPNCSILQINGQSSYNVALSRPTNDLESHGAVTTDTMHLVVVPWVCIDGRLCEWSWQIDFKILQALRGYR